jgi:hypothetical protein
LFCKKTVYCIFWDCGHNDRRINNMDNKFFSKACINIYKLKNILGIKTVYLLSVGIPAITNTNFSNFESRRIRIGCSLCLFPGDDNWYKGQTISWYCTVLYKRKGQMQFQNRQQETGKVYITQLNFTIYWLLFKKYHNSIVRVIYSSSPICQ